MTRAPAQRLPSALLLGLGAVILPQPSLAFDTPEANGLQATDTAGASPFTFNVAAQDPKRAGFAFSEQVRNRTVKFNDRSNGQAATIRTEGEETLRALELSGASGGLIYGVGVNHSSTEHRSRNDQNRNFEDNPLLETFKRTEARGKFSLELTKDLRFGGIVRYRYLEADVLGNFFMPLDERTKFKGSLIGTGAGAQFNGKSASIALQYLSAMEGKVSILGEEKITSEPGLLSLCGHVNAWTSLTFGGCYLNAIHSKDELRAPTTGPNPANQTRLAPKGVNPERLNHLIGAALLGFDAGLSPAVRLRLTAGLEEYERVRDTSVIPSGKSEGDEKFNGYRARLALSFTKDKVYAECGAEGALRENRFGADSNGSRDDIDVREYNFFGTLGVAF